MATQRKSLGRGLNAIISAGAKKMVDSADAKLKKVPQTPVLEQKDQPVRIASHGLFSEIAIDKVIAGKYQARQDFDDSEISELADSIASEGLLQPILVRQASDGNFELLAGERRWRACKKLGLKKIVACVQNVSDVSAAIKGLIENIQRADLNPMEESKGIANLMANFRLTQDSIAQRVGKPRSSIANSLRLLKLPPEIQGFIAKGMLSLGHAKVIMGIEDPVQQTIISRRIIENGLNVRATEAAIARMKSGQERRRAGSPVSSTAQNVVIADLEKKVSSKLKAPVEIKHAGKRGKIIVQYADNVDLQRILEIVGVKL